jgi:hypothetical protein
MFIVFVFSVYTKVFCFIESIEEYSENGRSYWTFPSAHDPTLAATTVSEAEIIREILFVASFQIEKNSFRALKLNQACWQHPTCRLRISLFLCLTARARITKSDLTSVSTVCCRQRQVLPFLLILPSPPSVAPPAVQLGQPSLFSRALCSAGAC